MNNAYVHCSLLNSSQEEKETRRGGKNIWHAAKLKCFKPWGPRVRSATFYQNKAQDILETLHKDWSLILWYAVLISVISCESPFVAHFYITQVWHENMAFLFLKFIFSRNTLLRGHRVSRWWMIICALYMEHNLKCTSKFSPLRSFKGTRTNHSADKKYTNIILALWLGSWCF